MPAFVCVGVFVCASVCVVCAHVRKCMKVCVRMSMLLFLCARMFGFMDMCLYAESVHWCCAGVGVRVRKRINVRGCMYWLKKDPEGSVHSAAK